jgi:hypothetical protein
VFPFDQMEARTEAEPVLDGRDGPILLRSHNASTKTDRRAWCWSCDGFTICKRLDRADIAAMYLERRGVVRRPLRRRRG